MEQRVEREPGSPVYRKAMSQKDDGKCNRCRPCPSLAAPNSIPGERTHTNSESHPDSGDIDVQVIDVVSHLVIGGRQ